MNTAAKSKVVEELVHPPIEYGVSDAAIGELRDKYSGLLIVTKDDYKEVSVAIREVVTLRTGVEKMRKELKAGALEWGRNVDAEAKRITALLTDIEMPLKELKAEVDERKEREKAEAAAKEEARISSHKANLTAIQRISGSLLDASPSEVEAAMLRHADYQREPYNWEEFEVEAEIVHLRVQDELKALLASAVARKEAAEQAERDKAELAELRAQKAKDDMARKEAEARAAAERDEQARALREAQQAKKEAEQAAEDAQRKLREEQQAERARRQQEKEAEEARRLAQEREQDRLAEAATKLLEARERGAGVWGIATSSDDTLVIYNRGFSDGFVEGLHFASSEAPDGSRVVGSNQAPLDSVAAWYLSAMEGE